MTTSDAKPSALDKVASDIDDMMQELTKLSDVVWRSEHPAYYAMNRAWRALDEARDMLLGRRPR